MGERGNGLALSVENQSERGEELAHTWDKPAVVVQKYAMWSVRITVTHEMGYSN